MANFQSIINDQLSKNFQFPSNQFPNKSQFPNMSNFQTKKYDNPLDDRTLEFGKKIIRLCKKLPKNTVTIEPIKQVMRSGCSIGANYREANDALSKKDFVFRMRISRKESKETMYWLELLIEACPEFRNEITPLMQEALELVKILSSIIEKSK